MTGPRGLHDLDLGHLLHLPWHLQHPASRHHPGLLTFPHLLSILWILFLESSLKINELSNLFIKALCFYLCIAFCFLNFIEDKWTFKFTLYSLLLYLWSIDYFSFHQAIRKLDQITVQKSSDLFLKQWCLMFTNCQTFGHKHGGTIYGFLFTSDIINNFLVGALSRLGATNNQSEASILTFDQWQDSAGYWWLGWLLPRPGNIWPPGIPHHLLLSW